jgi:type I restriction enzyme, S subunit
MEKWNLPDGWEWRTINDLLISIKTGTTPPSQEAKYFNGSIQWYTPGDIGYSKILESSSRTITNIAVEDGKARVFEPETLLVTCIGNIGRVGIVKQSSSANQQITGLLFNSEIIDVNFAYYWFRAYQKQIEDFAPVALLRILNQANLKQVPIPIPFPNDPARSLETQKRIVLRLETLLGEVKSARELQETIEEDTGQLLDSVISSVFDDQEILGWQTNNLHEVAYIQTGIAKGKRYGNQKLQELPYLRVANVQSGYLDLDEVKTIILAEIEIERYRLQNGDLLLTEGGDFDKLGRGAVWNSEIDPCVHQNHIFAVRLDQEKVLPRFAEYAMQSKQAKAYFVSKAKKTTNLASINKSQLSAFPLFYPSINEQKAIIERIDSFKREVQEIKTAQIENKELIEQLEQSFLSQAFRGEL